VGIVKADEATEVSRVIAESCVSNQWLFRLGYINVNSIHSRIEAGQLFLCARLNFRIIGAVWIRIQGPVAALEMLSVVPETRRRGVGSRLIAYAENEALTRECKQLQVVTADELGLSSMFINAGFTAIEREMVYQAAFTTQPFCRVLYEKRIG
jgi:N-acetylglutamate synthase-like GNAT family acetyltransferase